MQPLAPRWVETLLAAATWHLAPLIALAISGIYFRASAGAKSPLWRVLSSVHGALIALIHLAATIVAYTGHSNVKWGQGFTSLLLLPVVSMAFALITMRRSLRMHLLLIPEFACLLWVGFIDGMAITGKWL